jgi:dipeptidyl aminopeptidase/acylaminoacyl peptidase
MDFYLKFSPVTKLAKPSTALAMMLALSLGIASSSAALAQEHTGVIPKNVITPVTNKKVITHDVYAGWRSIAGSVLSRDGAWAAYALVGQESDGEVVVKRLADGKEYRSPRGSNPSFSADGQYVAFAVVPTKADLEKAKKEKKKPEEMPKAGVGLMDLATGKVEVIERVKRFAWPQEGGAWLAVHLDAPLDVKKEVKKEADAADSADVEEGEADQQAPNPNAANAPRKNAGTELIVWNVSENKRHSFKDVADIAWNKNGSRLAYSVVAKEAAPAPATAAAVKKDSDLQQTQASTVAPVTTDAAATVAVTEGVFVFTPVDAKSKAIFVGNGSVKQMSFDEEGKQLAFVSNRDQLATIKKLKANAKNDKKAIVPNPENLGFSLFYWNSDLEQAKMLVNAETQNMLTAWAPSEFGDVSFSKDGKRLFLNTAELPKIAPKDAPEAMKVDLWHWKDPELQAMQKVNAERDKNRSYRAVVHLADQRFVQLANKEIPQMMVNENADFAMGISSLPYRMLQSWDSLYYDAYAVDLKTGAARKLIEKTRFAPRFSPAGKYIVNFDSTTSTWFSYATSDGKKTNLTGSIKTRFENTKRDTPEPARPYGVAGWTTDDATVVIYDQYDLWEINPSNSAAKNLTAGYGRKNKLELRYVNLDVNRRGAAFEFELSPDSKAMPSDSAWVLSATHEINMSTGYFKWDPKADSGKEPSRLIFGDKLYAGLQKAANSDAVLLTQQSFTEFPDLWASDVNLKSPQKISSANPQQNQYNWGTQEMIEYTTADGKKLKALLAKPENFDPKKKYPMMVYVYENMTENMHRHVVPAPGQNINVTRYLSNGYIVLRPDIEYKTGYPGKSAFNTVVPAVKQVIAKGFVDPKRVGIQGHSWGAYQINYLITKTDMFAAVEAGASMANMISGYGGIRWGTGMSRAFQYEKQQSRIGGTPWDSREKYVENSPIFWIDKVKTPYLTVHNDDDDAVPYYQAIEFVTALRRLNKEAYWFNYNGEKHGLRDRENIKHFTVHMTEFFDHYLKGEARPEWMDKPVPYLEKGKRDVMGLFKPKAQVEAKVEAKTQTSAN